MSDIYFPPRELAVMSVLWRLGSASVTEVREALEEDLAYTSVLSALQTLEEKGFVRHEEQGRAFRYIPRVARKTAKASAVKRLVQKLFDGETRLLATELMSNRALSDDDLRQLRALLDQRLSGRDT